MIALVQKDTAAAAPFWLMALSLVFLRSLLLVFSPIGLAPPSADPGLGEDGVMLVVLVAFAIGHGSGASEVRDGTIHLLDGLPVRRVTVFFAKLVALIAPIVVMVVAAPVLSVIVTAPFVEPGLRSAWPLVWTEVHALLPVAFGSLGLGMAMSWLGGLGWGVFLVTWMTLGVAAAPIAPLRPYLPAPFGDLGAIVWVGAEPQVYGAAGGVWLGMGVVGALISGLLFLGPGEQMLAAGSRLRGGVQAVAVGCGSLFWLAVCALVALALTVQQVPTLVNPVTRMDEGSIRALWRQEDDEGARGRLADAVAMSARVAELLGSDPDLPFDLEMTGVARNHLGQTVPGKVRLATDAEPAVLAHELAHVHALAMMGDGAFRNQGSRNFFDEGLAEWVDRRLVPDDTPLVFAGAVARTGQARFDVLVDEARHRNHHDMAQAYPLGEVFVDALVDVGGDATPGCVVRALATEGGYGVSLWAAATRACGVELDDVLDAWWARLDALGALLPADLPVLEATLVHDGDRPWLEVLDRTPHEEPWELVCRFRQDGTEPFSRYQHTPVIDGVCTVPVSALAGAEFDAQVGFELDNGESVMMPWVRLPLVANRDR